MALVTKPIDFDRLFTVIMEQFIENQYDRNRLLRVAERVPLKIEGKFDLATENIGFGGFFIPCTDSISSQWLPTVKVGQLVEFTYALPTLDAEFRGKGEIVWTRLFGLKKTMFRGVGSNSWNCVMRAARASRTLFFSNAFAVLSRRDIEITKVTLGGKSEYKEQGTCGVRRFY